MLEYEKIPLLGSNPTLSAQNCPCLRAFLLSVSSFVSSALKKGLFLEPLFDKNTCLCHDFSLQIFHQRRHLWPSLIRKDIFHKRNLVYARASVIIFSIKEKCVLKCADDFFHKRNLVYGKSHGLFSHKRKLSGPLVSQLSFIRNVSLLHLLKTPAF